MKIRTRILSLIAAAALLVAAVPLFTMPVSAATYSGSCGTNVTYTLDTSTGVLTISGMGSMADYSLEVGDGDGPGGTDVYTTAPWGSRHSYPKSVVIEAEMRLSSKFR